jgi:hypothetical protein
VLDQTRQRAAEISVQVHELPSGIDIDDQATLQRLCDELLGGKSKENIAPETSKFLGGIIGREGRERIWPRL